MDDILKPTRHNLKNLSTMKHYTIHFPEINKPDLILPQGARLSEHLDAVNSPMLFGCRSGICGTCLCEITETQSQLSPPNDEELEALMLYAPGNVKARLACQVVLEADIVLKKIASYE